MTVDAARIAPEVARHLDALPEICRRHHVRWLDLFGSAAGGDFDPDRSDVDVLAEFDWREGVSPARTYFGLSEDLERLFGRPVDVIVDGTIRNKYLLPYVEASRVRLFP